MTTEYSSPENQPSRSSSRLNFSTITNLVLFAGLIVLYGLYFFRAGSVSEDLQDQIDIIAEKPETSLSNLAYVDSEVLMERYLLAAHMRQEFDSEQQRLENDLTRRQRNFQAEVEKFQNDISTGRINMELAQQKEQELMLMQQELMQLNDTYSSRLNQKEMEMNNELFETISDFLQRYNEEKRYDFILSYSRGGNVLFASVDHDITEEVLERMNKEYSETNP